MTHSKTHASNSSPFAWANPLSMAVLGEAYTTSVLRNGSAAVSKTAGRGSIPRTFANPPAEGLRAEKASVSAATPRLSVLARAGGFSFSGVVA